MERLTDIEMKRLYNLRAYGYLNAKPEVDQVLQERGLIEERMVLAGGNISKASEITEEGLQLLEDEDEYIRCCSVTIQERRLLLVAQEEAELAEEED